MDTNTIYIVYTRVLVSCTNYSLLYDISGIFTFCTCKKIMLMRFPSSSHQNEYEVRKRERHLIYTVDLPSTVYVCLVGFTAANPIQCWRQNLSDSHPNLLDWNILCSKWIYTPWVPLFPYLLPQHWGDSISSQNNWALSLN